MKMKLEFSKKKKNTKTLQKIVQVRWNEKILKNPKMKMSKS